MAFIRLYCSLFLVLLGAFPAAADTFTLAGSGGNWSANATWLQNGAPATRAPGSLAGTMDAITLDGLTYAVTVDVVVAEAVTLDANCTGGPCVVDVNQTLIVAGGTMADGTTLVLDNWPATLRITAGKTFEVRGTMQWSDGGDIEGPGTLRVFNGAAGTGNELCVGLRGAATLSIAGTFTHQTTCLIMYDTTAIQVEAGGIFELLDRSAVQRDTFAVPATPSMTNHGTIRKTGTDFADIGVPLTSAATGEIRVIGGEFILSQGATIGSLIDIAANSTFAVNGSSPYELTADARVQGSGTLRISYSEDSPDQGPQVTITPDITVSNIILQGGRLLGSGNITAVNAIWNETQLVGTGAFTLTGEMTVTTRYVDFPCTRPFHNQGRVTVSGYVSLFGGGTHTGSFVFDSSDPFQLDLAGTHLFTPSSSVNGLGSVAFWGGDITIAGIFDVGETALAIGGATVRFIGPSPVRTKYFTLVAGELTGTSDIHVTGNYTEISGGRISGTGALTFDGLVHFLPFDRIVTVSGRRIDFHGETNVWGSTPIVLQDGASFVNHGQFLLNFADIRAGSGGGSFINHGTFTATGVMPFGPDFTNHGAVEFEFGGLEMAGAYVQKAGTTSMRFGMSSPHPIRFEGGTVIAGGEIEADVVNAVLLTVGNNGSPATWLRIKGNYTQSATGALKLDIGGTEQYIDYDLVEISGTATLDGAIDVALIDGYAPADGVVFDLITYATRNGAFAAETYPEVFERTYEPQSYRLTADLETANLEVTQTNSGDTHHGQSATFTVTVRNLGVDPAEGVMVSNSVSGGSVTSATTTVGACNGTSTVTCDLGVLAAGESAVITITVTAGAAGTMTNDASAVTNTIDIDPSNNNAVSTLGIAAAADLAVAISGPATVQGGDLAAYTITITNNGPDAAENVVITNPLPGGLTFISSSGEVSSLQPQATATITTLYSVGPAIAGGTITNDVTVSSATHDLIAANNSASAVTFGFCPEVTLSELAPSGGTMPRNGALTWSNTPGVLYEVFFGRAGSGCSTYVGRSTTGAFAFNNLESGASYEWRVQATFGACDTVSSSCMTFVADECMIPAATQARAVAQTASSHNYDVEWDVVPGAAHYEIDEATNEQFSGAVTYVVDGALSKTFTHDVATATTFFYRVRALADCASEPGPYSLPVRVVLAPLSNIVPAGSTEPVVQELFVPGQAGQTLTYSATTDAAWLTVQPATGALPPEGVTPTVTADPSQLPNGTSTATVLVTISGGALTAHSVMKSPVSIHLITPLTPIVKRTPAGEPIVVPAISPWRTDVRIANTSAQTNRYRLTFGSAQTIVSAAAGETIALDDVVITWFGAHASGALEIVPLGGSAGTIVSSRTYDVSGGGTRGDFLPAVPLRGFIGRGMRMSMQHVAQNGERRTNIGIVEGAGAPADVLLSAFDAHGVKLFDEQARIEAWQSLQFNALLAEHGVSVDDARVEVQVTNGEGRVTAYAAVIRNDNGDVLLVPGTPLVERASTQLVLPMTSGGDIRVFNHGTAAQSLSLHGRRVVAPGEVVAIDDVPAGVVHADLPQPSTLIVSARNAGHFIPALSGARSLQLVHLEQSAHYRTTIGLTEVSGAPVTVQLTIIAGGEERVIDVTLAANESRRLDVLEGDVYNARVAINVTSSEGRVAAYAVLTDTRTGDSSFLPAQ